MVQGAEDGVEGLQDGVAWSFAINESTGKMVLTESGEGVGFVYIGACTPQYVTLSVGTRIVTENHTIGEGEEYE